jgi:hypothetical protein
VSRENSSQYIETSRLIDYRRYGRYLVGGALILASSLVVACGGNFLPSLERPNYTPAPMNEQRQVIAAAHGYYDAAKIERRDLSKGPCLVDILPGFSDWSVDTVSKPRAFTDDLMENQCPAYLESRTHHFVELDKDTGALVRVY